MNLSSGVVSQAIMPSKVAGYTVHLSHALRVRLWLDSEVRAMSLSRPVYPRERTLRMAVPLVRS